jgi:hypothetical protein
MDVPEKIQRLVALGPRITEDQTRSLMILIRKQLELLDEGQRSDYSTLNLFCNWCAHTEITQSLAGLRVLGAINDALVKVKDAHTDDARKQLTAAVGLATCRAELVALAGKIGLKHDLDNQDTWSSVQRNLIEIITDVPLAFPPVSKLSKRARGIYEKIVQNPIKPGAGVMLIVLTKVDYGLMGAQGIGELMCLLVRTENGITLVVPLDVG